MMNAISRLLLLLILFGPPLLAEKQELTPEVLRFWKLCDKDACAAETWLSGQIKDKKLKQESSDQMLEILSGIVWEKDRAKAREIAKRIQDEKRRAGVLRQYEALEELDSKKERA